MVGRLLDAGYDVSVWNRTREKADLLEEQGCLVVGSPAELAGCDIVFTMVGGSEDFKEVTVGDRGVLSNPERAPGILIDSSTVSAEASDTVRTAATRVGTALLAVLEALGRGVTYVGEGDRARLVKICHNLALGIVAETLAEITVLAESGGISRSDFLSFFNDSVMGSTFSRYKTPAFVTLDYTPTFTPLLLRKDFDLGLDAAAQLGVSVPLVARARELVQAMIDEGYTEVDFAALLSVRASASGLELEPESGPVWDGLGEREPASS
jgi:3-hydroxyisobutyrate dehydrogenase